MVTDANFEAEVLNSDKPVLVDFFAEWCGPCKMLGMVIQSAAAKIEDKVKVCKVNVEEAPNAAAKYGVMSVPTVMIIKNGNVAEKKIGAMPEEALIAFVNANV